MASTTRCTGEDARKSSMGFPTPCKENACIPGTSRIAGKSPAFDWFRPEPAPPPPRPAYFGKERGWIDTPVRRRSDLKAASSGPLIVEEYDSTCIIPPDAHAELDAGGNIVIAL